MLHLVIGTVDHESQLTVCTLPSKYITSVISIHTIIKILTSTLSNPITYHYSPYIAHILYCILMLTDFSYIWRMSANMF